MANNGASVQTCWKKFSTDKGVVENVRCRSLDSAAPTTRKSARNDEGALSAEDLAEESADLVEEAVRFLFRVRDDGVADGLEFRSSFWGPHGGSEFHGECIVGPQLSERVHGFIAGFVSAVDERCVHLDVSLGRQIGRRRWRRFMVLCNL